MAPRGAPPPLCLENTHPTERQAAPGAAQEAADGAQGGRQGAPSAPQDDPEGPLQSELQAALSAAQAAAALPWGDVRPQHEATLCAAADPASQLRAAQAWVAAWEGAGRPQPGPAAAVFACTLAAPVPNYLAALAAQQAAQWDAAEVALAAVATDPDVAWQAEAALRRAQIALHRGLRPRAEGCLRRAVHLAPERVDVRLALAQALAAWGEPGATHAALMPLFELQPSAPEIARARAILEASVRASEPPMDPPRAAVAQTFGAMLAGQAAEPGDASAALATAARLDHPRLAILAGLVALRDGADAAALLLLRRAQEQSPYDSDAPRLIAGHALAHGAIFDALAALSDAWQRNPFDVEVAMLLAPAAQTAGDWRTARRVWGALCVLQPEVTTHAAALARARRVVADMAAARAAAAQGPPSAAAGPAGRLRTWPRALMPAAAHAPATAGSAQRSSSLAGRAAADSRGLAWACRCHRRTT